MSAEIQSRINDDDHIGDSLVVRLCDSDEQPSRDFANKMASQPRNRTSVVIHPNIDNTGLPAQKESLNIPNLVLIKNSPSEIKKVLGKYRANIIYALDPKDDDDHEEIKLGDKSNDYFVFLRDLFDCLDDGGKFILLTNCIENLTKFTEWFNKNNAAYEITHEEIKSSTIGEIEKINLPEGGGEFEIPKSDKNPTHIFTKQKKREK